ncbi:TPA: hypothetical protein ACQJG0_005084 [Escherichia coli]|nr:hypothetical protein [Enterobacter hormaechei subsp. xiangfangensis]
MVVSETRNRCMVPFHLEHTMLYYLTDAFYRQIISELPFPVVACPTTLTDKLTLLLRAFLSGFRRLARVLACRAVRLVAYSRVPTRAIHPCSCSV